jgi:hypothetical protein
MRSAKGDTMKLAALVCALALAPATTGCLGSRHHQAGYAEKGSRLALLEKRSAGVAIVGSAMLGVAVLDGLYGLGGRSFLEDNQRGTLGIGGAVLAAAGGVTILACEAYDLWHAPVREHFAAERERRYAGPRARSPELWDSIDSRKRIGWWVMGGGLAANLAAFSDGEDSTLAETLGPPSAIAFMAGAGILIHNGMRERAALRGGPAPSVLVGPGGVFAFYWF